MFTKRGIIKLTRVHPPDLAKVLACTALCLLDPPPFSWLLLLDHMTPFIGIPDVSVLVGYPGLMAREKTRSVMGHGGLSVSRRCPPNSRPQFPSPQSGHIRGGDRTLPSSGCSCREGLALRSCWLPSWRVRLGRSPKVERSWEVRVQGRCGGPRQASG